MAQNKNNMSFLEFCMQLRGYKFTKPRYIMFWNNYTPEYCFKNFLVNL